MIFKLLVSSTVLSVTLVGGCGGERRADEGCPDEKVLAATGACCDPAEAVIVNGISDCAGSVVRPDAGMPDAGPDASVFVFPCPKDQLVDWRGECIKVTVRTDGGTDGGADAGECVPVIVERCPPPQERDPETGLCLSEDNPDGGTECPHFACPAGQVLREGRCADLVEACRFTCTAGEVLDMTDQGCDCIPRPVCPDLCPTGQQCLVPTVCPPAWKQDCAATQYLTPDGQQCVTPAECPALCPTGQQCMVPTGCPNLCPEGQQHNAQGTCVPVPPAWNQTCGVNQYITPNGQQCVNQVVCPNLCPEGQQHNAQGDCVPVPPAWNQTCGVNQYITPNGQQCVTPAVCPVLPTAKVEVSFLIPPSLRPRPQVAPAQTNVPMGTVALRNVSNTLPAEITSLPIQLLVADDVAGAFSAGSSGTVRANERVTGCRLVEWPPSTSIIGPVTPDQNGRVVFTTALRVDTARFYDLQCGFANLDPVGTGDAYAADVLTGVTATSVDGTQRPALSAVIGTTNGTTPTGSVSVECNYGIRRANGTTVRVRSRPFFTRLNATASTVVTPGWVEAYAFNALVAACEGVDVTAWTWTFQATNTPPSKLFENVTNNLATRMKMVNQANATVGSFSVTASGGANVMYVRWTPGPTWSAGMNETFRLLVNATGALSTDTLKVTPSQPIWTGSVTPSAYPADMDDPTFQLPDGLLFSFP